MALIRTHGPQPTSARRHSGASPGPARSLQNSIELGRRGGGHSENRRVARFARADREADHRAPPSLVTQKGSLPATKGGRLRTAPKYTRCARPTFIVGARFQERLAAARLAAKCGSNRFSLNRGIHDRSLINCEDCGHEIGTLERLKQMVAAQVLKHSSQSNASQSS